MAIESKVENLHYDSLYSEIEHLTQKYGFRELDKTSPVPVTDERLQELLEQIEQKKRFF